MGQIGSFHSELELQFEFKFLEKTGIFNKNLSIRISVKNSSCSNFYNFRKNYGRNNHKHGNIAIIKVLRDYML